MSEETFLFPYENGKTLGELRLHARVLTEKFEENGCLVSVRAYPETLAKYGEFRV